MESFVVVSAGEAVRSAVAHSVVLTRVTFLIWICPSRDGNRIRITGDEREPGRLPASGLQQIKKRGGTGSEADKDELATGVLQHLANGFHGAHPQSSMSLRNSKELKTTGGMHRCLARRRPSSLGGPFGAVSDGGSDGDG